MSQKILVHGFGWRWIPLVILVYSPVVFTMQIGEDFSSNLISDLAPILALFGEQVTRQFMASSTSWEEHIILAMAPIGIITAITGVVRIGGPLWLRALIGRARENKATAEVELTTSTSRDVCELWEGSKIVRLAGSPRILQLIFFPNQWDRSDFGLVTLNDGQQRNIITRDSRTKRGGFSNFISTFFGSQAPQTDEESKRASVRRAPMKTLQDAPNIFLNLQPPRSLRQRWEFRFWAIFGIALQAGVLVFSGFATYYKAYKKEDGESVAGYAYPSTVAGTVIMIAGMVVCAYIVDWSTKEECWSFPENERNARIVWLQEGGNISDQNFESYAVFANGERGSILTSSLAVNVNRGSSTPHHHTKSKGGTLSAQEGDRTSTTLIVASKPIQMIVITGAFMAIGGFIIQFTGLRGMDWSASVGQLIATLIMILVRAWVRRDLSSGVSAHETPQQHSLDWLATRLARDSVAIWGASTKTVVDDSSAIAANDKKLEHSGPEYLEKLNDQRCWEWRIATGLGTQFFRLKGVQIPSQSDSSNLAKSIEGAQRVMKIRERIGYLSGWQGVVSQPAISVANAIEVVMNSLFANDDRLAMTWTMPVKTMGEETELVSFGVRRNDKTSRWQSNAAEIEAALSLWLYSVRVQSLLKQEDECSENSHDWLRNGKVAMSSSAIRLLGPKTERYTRDLRWYLQPEMDSIVVVKGSESLRRGLYKFSTQPLEAPTDISATQEHQIDCLRVFGTFEFKNSEAGNALHADKEIQTIPASVADPQLGIVSDKPFEILFAQEVLSAFMWGVSKAMKRIKGNTTVHPKPNASWKMIGLENDKLSTMLKNLEKVAGESLGTLEDIYLCVLPALSWEDKLPLPDCLLSYALEIARQHEAVDHWFEAVEVYSWLLQEYTCFEKEHPSRVRATAAVLDFLHRAIHGRIELMRQEKHGKDAVASIQKLRDTLQAAVGKNCEPETVRQLSDLRKLHDSYSNQTSGHQFKPDDLPALPFPGSGIYHQGALQGKYQLEDRVVRRLCEVDLVGLTPLHYAVMSQTQGPCEFFNPGKPVELALNFKDYYGWNPLHYAVARGLSEWVQKIAESGIAEINSKNVAGRTPLYYAGVEQIAWTLLKAGAEVDSQGRDGSAPLHRAAAQGHLEIVRLLIEVGATIDILDNSRRTPLHWAVQRGQVPIAKLLLEKGANPALREANGKLPLHLAALSGSLTVEMFEMLNGKYYLGYLDGSGMSPLHLACMAGEVETAKLLLKQGAEYIKAHAGQDRWNLLHAAASMGAASTVQLLIKDNTDVVCIKDIDNNGRTPLMIACSVGHPETARILIEGKSDVNANDKKGNTPLHMACQNGNENVVEMLLNLGASVTCKTVSGETPLQLACSYGQDRIVQYFINKPQTHLNLKDSKGNTLLHLACSRGHLKTAQVLIIDGNAEIDAQNSLGQTPLHVAAAGSNDDIVQFLITQGKANAQKQQTVDINAKDKTGQTPLHLSCCSGGPESITRVLIEEGKADVNARDREGSTPLHLACSQGSLEKVRLLLKEKLLDIDLRNERGETPLHETCRYGTMDIFRLLIVEGNADVQARDDSGKTALHHAIWDEEKVWWLLEDGRVRVDIEAKDNTGGTPLMEACKETQVAAARLLIMEGKADVNTTDQDQSTPLHKAASQPGREATATVLMLLSDERLKIDAQDRRGRTPLHLACACQGTMQNVDNIKALIEAGAEVEAQDQEGLTALHTACRQHHIDISHVITLIKYANVEATAPDGKTALHFACQGFDHNHQAVASLIREGNADVKIKDNDGETPLHLACQNGNDKVIQAIIQEGGAIDVVRAKNNMGSTPLHVACHRDHISTVQVLLDAGADINATDNNGLTPLDKSKGSAIKGLLGQRKALYNKIEK